MESSEDDAGTATSASRRASAREKDVGQAEDVDTTRNFQHELPETRTSCGTPAMSEDNFDGDSVPSPSTQNTSTEAILDMIDEIVDGPGAPKRLPFVAEVAADFACDRVSTPTFDSLNNTEAEERDNQIAVPLHEPSPAARADSESAPVQPIEAQCTPHSEALICATKTTSAGSPQASCSVQVDVAESASIQPVEQNNALEIVESETLTQQSSMVSVSNNVETVQVSSDSSECENVERTVKCVTSSDNRDSVTVEKAESTSSECSVSESKVPSMEPVTRSPLKRRLVRPAPSDRRPDSTVSSTVDSQTTDIHTTQGMSSETIAKDVSSSSDAVPTVHGNIKPEEISNVSEISICKAETSTAPTRKIKLVRPKVTPVIRNSVKIETQPTPPTLEKEQCQSTSSDDGSTLCASAVPVGNSSSITTSKSEDQETKPVTVGASITEQQEQPALRPQAPQNTLPAQDVIVNEKIHETPPTTDKSPEISPLDQKVYEPCAEGSSTDIQIEVEKQSSDNKSDTNMLDEERKVPPIKLTLLVTTSQCESNTNDLTHCTKPKVEIVRDTPQNDQSEPQAASHIQAEVPPVNCDHDVKQIELVSEANDTDNTKTDFRKVPPIKLNLTSDHNRRSESPSSIKKLNVEEESPSHKSEETVKQVPKLTIKLTNKHTEDMKSPVPKLTIKPIRPPTEQNTDDNFDKNQQIPCVTKINIKPILKPSEKVNDGLLKPHPEAHQNDLASKNEQVPCVTKLNIKPIRKPPEKINEIHRKSSSSEISESEYSENDESTSTSDQASASEQGSLDTVPKVTIKLGKPGTESEGKFYTEQNIPKLTIKNIQDDQDSKMKLVISQSEEKQLEKIPKLTIKTVAKPETQPLSPKLTIKPLKVPENVNKDNEIPKLKISSESFPSTTEVKENLHVPKITIKPVTKTDADGAAKTPKKSTVMCDSSEHIPVVTKLNIKPILKPTESGESSENFEKEKVPVVSKLNIKPIVKPKDNEVDSSIEDVPKIIKLNIKPLKNPEECSSEEKDCDEMNADMKNSSIPVVTKLNIKPIVKPVEEEASKDSENQSSETGNSSDDNADHIPIVTKLNIKPIIKPSELEECVKSVHNEQSIPVITKLNIKPLVKPEDSTSPSSPKKESSKSPGSAGIPIVTKINIKPIVKPEDPDSKNKAQDESTEKLSKNPPLVMKINMKNVSENEHLYNNVAEIAHSPKMHSPKNIKSSATKETDAGLSSKTQTIRQVETIKNIDCPGSPSLLQSDNTTSLGNACELSSVPENVEITSKVVHSSAKEQSLLKPAIDMRPVPEQYFSHKSPASSDDNKTIQKNSIQINIVNDTTRFPQQTNASSSMTEAKHSPGSGRHKKSLMQNCTLLKKLLSNTKEDLDKGLEITSNCLSQSVKAETLLSNCNDKKVLEKQEQGSENANTEFSTEIHRRNSPKPEKSNELHHSSETSNMRSIQDVCRDANESVTKPLEISITDKLTNPSSGQDSPRIILKINKTDHGPSAKIITEEMNKPTDSSLTSYCENAVETVNDSPSPKKHLVNSRRKPASTDTASLTMGKRLRSSRIVENTEKSPALKRNVNKRPSAAEPTSTNQNKDNELSLLETKRLKLEQLLSVNKSLSITPVMSKNTQTSPSKSCVEFKQGGKTIVTHNHSLLNNDNCSQKNGNSKLHNILSNLQAKQIQTLALNDASVSEKVAEIVPEVESNTSTGSSDVIVEITRVENCHPEVQEMIINENSVCDLTGPDEISQDPLEVETSKAAPVEINETSSVKTIEIAQTPQPRKRGRPRKLPVSESAKPPTPAPLPVPALEERPQRSLRLMRDRPAILSKPRGRGRGRGGRRAASPAPEPEPKLKPKSEPELETVIVVETLEERAPSPIDPTSSRIKLPRMTEALDKSVAGCTTPLSSRRRSSAMSSDLKLFGEAAVVIESPVKAEEFMKSPETSGPKPRGGRGSRGGQRGRTPRGRGRGRGGGRGAMYMKETMGIYGRVCGPATTTVQLFEEETCMMDDNATPSKPSHLLDEDSQSSVKSSTNDSNKMKKSKFADLFDSNKVWVAADVKEYTWPPLDMPNAEPQVMMIQEQVAMFLGVKSFKRRYPELKRRTVGGEEREYVLSKGVVTEALCDLGITAVDASEVLDIMLSDYPHKYEEYRSHQRARQIAMSSEETVESKSEERPTKLEVKAEKSSDKPEPPKVDPEKTRQDMAKAAIASASEWNARANAWRRPACVDLQSMTIHRRRAPPPAPPPPRVRPPAGFYPHALLPGQFQHWYRVYTPEQLRYFPLNTVVAAPPAPPSPVESETESEASWGEHSSSSDDSDTPHHNSAKRKKLTKVKRSSQQDKDKEDSRGAAEGEVDTCRVCKLRLEANRKYTHERFLVCANCNAKLHPSCVELSADTIRKCREYAWQCAECKSCCACRRPQDDDKMLFCDLCDRGFHIYCVGLEQVPSGRWHCVECAICKSCGARDPNGLAGATAPGTPGPSGAPATPGAPAAGGEWHHQTRRGPGGHKMYSHSLCTPCARAYRIGRYCPLCERSFIGPKGTMQLVICKLCDRQLHQDCVRATVSHLKVLDYTCAECRRGGITSRAAAVRVAPRTIATLFMAKRRFNKYAHRQYMQSRMQALQDASSDAPSDPTDRADEPDDGSDPLDGAGDPPPDFGD